MTNIPNDPLWGVINTGFEPARLTFRARSGGEPLSSLAQADDEALAGGGIPDERTASGARSEPGLHDEGLEALADRLEGLFGYLTSQEDDVIELGAEACRRLKECREQREAAERDVERLQKALAQAMKEVASLTAQRDAYVSAVSEEWDGSDEISRLTDRLEVIQSVVEAMCADNREHRLIAEAVAILAGREEGE